MSQDSRRDSLGWNSWFEDHWLSFMAASMDAEGAPFPARVIGEERGLFRLHAKLRLEPLDPSSDAHPGGVALETLWGEPTGSFRRGAGLYPAVGDWVCCSRESGQERASIHDVLPRASCLERRAAGTSERPQVLAANVDIAFVVTSLDADLNPRRIERYLATIWDGGARPVVLLTKRDLCGDAERRIAEVTSIASGADVLAVSAVTGEGMESFASALEPGQTGVLLGSSGVGKSTLINRLLGSALVPTQPVRESDGRGRHTTTSRYLWTLPSGAFVIDTPGMRELQLWVDQQGLDAAFEDLQALAIGCRYTDCQHRTEPGCAIKSALENGTLTEERLAAHDKLKREMDFQARKQDKAKASGEKARWKKIARQAEARMKSKRWREPA